MDTREYCNKAGFEIVYTEEIKESPPAFFKMEAAAISETTNHFIISKYPNGIYKHQKKAFEYFLDNKNVCLTTSTASGKSLCFYLASIELLARNKNTKIIAVYPTLALGNEQEKRLKEVIKISGIDVKVGRIDGKVPVSQRIGIINESSIIIFTPDVMHAWLFSQIGDRKIIQFLSNLKLVIVDEVHTYTGVFGSNSAFLFRRLNHVLSLLGQSTQFICASATIADTQGHLAKLFGIDDFCIVDQSMDSSPHHQVQIHLVKPPMKKDFFTETTGLLSLIAENKDNCFIVFVNSRKQTELLASVLNRGGKIKNDADMSIAEKDWYDLERLNILPFRAGYEEEDRLKIQERLTNGTLSGVISTSALELGMDIPHLNIGILIGVPNSATSLYQRIGRIGRHTAGAVLIVHQGTVLDETIFSNPSELMKRPLAEGALYMENQRIQYIHALCLAGRDSGEHDKVLNLKRKNDDEFKSNISWPDGFIELCNAERLGVISPELQAMKASAGDSPHYTFPLRNVEIQFEVKSFGPPPQAQGTLSYSQLMREAYPGAIFYNITRPLRVTNVNIRTHEVKTRKEKKHYSTSPIELPPNVFPNLTPGNVFQAKRIGNIIITESPLQVREAIVGYTETQGTKKINFQYPTNGENNIFYNQRYFSRNFFTTGITISHPAFDNPAVSLDMICNIFYEAFLMIVPYERRDISCAYDKHRQAHTTYSINEGTRFVVVYDRTYGSLRLTGRIFSESIFSKILEKALEIIVFDEFKDVNVETKKVFTILFDELQTEADDFPEYSEIRTIGEDLVKILLPNSHGFVLPVANAEFEVEGVFVDLKTGKLSYRGKYTNNPDMHDDTKVIWPVDSIIGVNGESRSGYYSLNTGEIIDGDINHEAKTGRKSPD
jgi:DEAD/DEAH box helicase domain-containing protein